MTITNAGPAYRIVTPRLIIRCWNPTDAPLLKKATEANVDHLLPWLPFARNEPEDLQIKIERIRLWRAKFDRDEDYVFGVFDPQETRVIGGTGLHKRVGGRAFEIGYWVDREMINKGLATEISAALVKVAFEMLDARRVEIHCDPLNQRSAAVPRKLGFTHEATLRERHLDDDDVWSDLMIWSIFRSEYPASPCKEIEIQAFDSAERRII
ncbi:MAG: GNAT family N-acetyltransferase [Bellilinea sp.]